MSNQNQNNSQLVVAIPGGQKIVAGDSASMQLIVGVVAELKQAKAGKKRKSEALIDVRKAADSYTHGFNIGDVVEYNWGGKKSLHSILGFQPVLGPPHDGSSVGPERKILKKAVPFENLVLHTAKYADSDDED
jgi:hypothetical protein